MRSSIEGRLAKLEAAQPDAKPYIVIGADEAECLEKLRKLKQAGEIDEKRSVTIVLTGIARSDAS